LFLIARSSAAQLGKTAYALVDALQSAIVLGRLFLVRWDEPAPGWTLGLSLPQDAHGSEWDWSYEFVHSKCAVVPGVSETLPQMPLRASDEFALYVGSEFHAVRSPDHVAADAGRPLDEAKARAERNARRLSEKLRGLPATPDVWSSKLMRADVARVFGTLGGAHPVLIELREKLYALHRDLPDGVYVQFQRNVPSRQLLLGEAMRPSAEVLAEMAPFAQTMRKAPYVVGMHIRTKMDEHLKEGDALLEPWDVDAFVDCYSNWARSQTMGSMSHRDDHAVAPDDWERHVVFLAADSTHARDRVRRKLVDTGAVADDRFLTFDTFAADTHAGPAVSNDGAQRVVLLRTYAEFFLFEHVDAALLTAWSTFGEAASDRAALREASRHFINHSNCRAEPRGCIEPYVPHICIFNPSHDHDHHDAQVDADGTPLEALRRIKKLEEQLAAAEAELKLKQESDAKLQQQHHRQRAPEARQTDNSSTKEL
jgi:hypothetical protein